MSSFVLASASPRRQLILQELGFEFLVWPSPAAEIDHDLFPERIPLVNAMAKAEAAAEQFPDQVVLGADTVIVFRDEVIGKPADLNDARQTLLRLGGATHDVVTGVALYHRARHLRCIFCARTAVSFRPLDEQTVNVYLDRVHVLDKAGSYAIQESGDLIVERINGPLDNVIGLPGAMVADALRCCGILPRR